MERLCCVLDADENYAVRMSACFNRKKALPYKTVAFSDNEEYRRCAAENVIEVLLVDDSIYPSLVDVATDTVVIRLCESEACMTAHREAPGILKYQAGDNIIRDVLDLCSDVSAPVYTARREGKARLVCVYSPNGCCGKTTFAMALAHMKGQREKVLYLNLEEFSDVSTELPERKGTLSDALFYYHTGDGRVASKIMSVVGGVNGFDYIPPTLCAEDLSYLTSEVITDFIRMVTEEGGYDIIIVDVGSLIKEPWKLLEISDIILSPRAKSVHQKRRQEEFERYLKLIGMERTVERIMEVDIISDESIAADGKVNYSRLKSSAYGRMVGAIDV